MTSNIPTDNGSSSERLTESLKLKYLESTHIATSQNGVNKASLLNVIG